MGDICQSCKDERAAKKPSLPPMERITLPQGVTDNKNFRKRKPPVHVCAYCDGETLVVSALATHKKREDSE